MESPIENFVLCYPRSVLHSKYKYACFYFERFMLDTVRKLESFLSICTKDSEERTKLFFLNICISRCSNSVYKVAFTSIKCIVFV